MIETAKKLFHVRILYLTVLLGLIVSCSDQAYVFMDKAGQIDAELIGLGEVQVERLLSASKLKPEFLYLDLQSDFQKILSAENLSSGKLVLVSSYMAREALVLKRTVPEARILVLEPASYDGLSTLEFDLESVFPSLLEYLKAQAGNNSWNRINVFFSSKDAKNSDAFRDFAQSLRESAAGKTEVQTLDLSQDTQRARVRQLIIAPNDEADTAAWMNKQLLVILGGRYQNTTWAELSTYTGALITDLQISDLPFRQPMLIIPDWKAGASILKEWYAAADSGEKHLQIPYILQKNE